jgi:threonine dehydrogenase-like Zn-dependent dehydrogenase
VEACGICGTDIHTGAGDGPVTGHEIAGTVLELGPGVEGLAPGAKVALDSSTPCGRCSACKNARQELCTNLKSFWGASFGFCPEMTAPALCALPSEGLVPQIACLQEPLGVAIDMVRLAAIEPGQNVLLMGSGPIGLMALPLIRRAGARRVFATGFRRRRARMECALKLGADVFIDPGETALTGFKFGCPIDRIIVTSPPPTLSDAFAVAAKGAIISFIGIGQGEEAFCRFDVNAFHFKKLQLRASFASPALYGPMALDLLREKVVDGNALISHVFPLDRIAEAFQVAARDPSAIKVVIQP